MGKTFLKKLNIMNISALKGFHNRIYEGVYQNEPIIVRVSDRRTKESIQEEVEVLNHVRHDVSIAEPLKVEGAYVIRDGGYVYAFFKKIDALNWHETTLTDAVHRNAGRALGALHASMRKVEGVKRDPYDAHPDIRMFRGMSERYNAELKKTLSCLDAYGRKESEYGLIHGDYLFSNLLYHGFDVTIIDFDDMEYGYYLYDIAVYFFYLLLGGDPSQIDKKANREVFRHFIKGYLSVNKEIKLDFNKIQTMFRLRQLKLLATIKQKMDPVDHGSWQKAYIELCEKQFLENKPFIEMDYQAMYDTMKEAHFHEPRKT